jgi:hypothetical protein
LKDQIEKQKVYNKDERKDQCQFKLTFRTHDSSHETGITALKKKTQFSTNPMLKDEIIICFLKKGSKEKKAK